VAAARRDALDAATGEVHGGDAPGGYGLDLGAVQQILDAGPRR
jgi:hypothetical protein